MSEESFLLNDVKGIYLFLHELYENANSSTDFVSYCLSPNHVDTMVQLKTKELLSWFREKKYQTVDELSDAGWYNSPLLNELLATIRDLKTMKEFMQKKRENRIDPIEEDEYYANDDNVVDWIVQLGKLSETSQLCLLAFQKNRTTVYNWWTDQLINK